MLLLLGAAFGTAAYGYWAERLEANWEITLKRPATVMVTGIVYETEAETDEFGEFAPASEQLPGEPGEGMMETPEATYYEESGE